MRENHKTDMHWLFLVTFSKVEQELLKAMQANFYAEIERNLALFLRSTFAAQCLKFKVTKNLVTWGFEKLIKPTEIILRCESQKVVSVRDNSMAPKLSPLKTRQCEPVEQLKIRSRLLPYPLSLFSSGRFSPRMYLWTHYRCDLCRLTDNEEPSRQQYLES